MSDQPQDVGTIEDALLKLLQNRIGEISYTDAGKAVGCNRDRLRKAIEVLGLRGYGITRHQNTIEWTPVQARESKTTVIDTSAFKGQHFCFGVTGDNHLASKYARLDVLEALFDIWAGAGVTEVLQL